MNQFLRAAVSSWLLCVPAFSQDPSGEQQNTTADQLEQALQQLESLWITNCEIGNEGAAEVADSAGCVV